MDVDEETIFKVTAHCVETNDPLPFEAAAHKLFPHFGPGEDFDSAVVLCRATFYMHSFGGPVGYGAMRDAICRGINEIDKYSGKNFKGLQDLLIEIRLSIAQTASAVDAIIGVLVTKGVVDNEEYGRALFLELSKRVSNIEAKILEIAGKKVFVR